MERGQISHAYLFSGPEHVGKFALAKMFAESLITKKTLSSEVNEPCKDALLDLIVVSPDISEKKGAIKQKDISIETVRDAKKSLSLFPYCGKLKVLIVDDAHKMNTAAQNAFLKILEEPNPTTVIILVTSEIERILPTIRSRAQIISFGLIGDEEMRNNFTEEIVHLSVGRPGLACFMCEDKNEFVARGEWIDQFQRLANGSLGDKLAMAEDLSKDVVRTIEKLNLWIWRIRNEVSERAGAENRNESYLKIEKIEKAVGILKNTNANAKVVLEALFMEL